MSRDGREAAVERIWNGAHGAPIVRDLEVSHQLGELRREAGKGALNEAHRREMKIESRAPQRVPVKLTSRAIVTCGRSGSRDEVARGAREVGDGGGQGGPRRNRHLIEVDRRQVCEESETAWNVKVEASRGTDDEVGHIGRDVTAERRSEGNIRGGRNVLSVGEGERDGRRVSPVVS